jgi:hypothetical protein
MADLLTEDSLPLVIFVPAVRMRLQAHFQIRMRGSWGVAAVVSLIGLSGTIGVGQWFQNIGR